MEGYNKWRDYEMKKQKLYKSKKCAKTNGEDQPGAKIPYLQKVKKLEKTIPHWANIFGEEANETRIEELIRVEVVGQTLCEKYAWAIPDFRALKILSHFSPLIEIGAGKGYWAHLMAEGGVDIVAYDRQIFPKDSWFDVKKGGPEILNEKVAMGRNLFLCYPDEDSSMSVECLSNFAGEYVIHVGELITTGTYSCPQAPWGRTSVADFQVALNEEYHCLLVASLPRYPFSKDCISVWKRTQWVAGKDASLEGCEEGDGDDDGDDDDGVDVAAKLAADPTDPGGEKVADEDEGEDEDEERERASLWASIPPEERLPTDVAAPCLQHLLSFAPSIAVDV